MIDKTCGHATNLQDNMVLLGQTVLKIDATLNVAGVCLTLEQQSEVVFEHLYAEVCYKAHLLELHGGVNPFKLWIFTLEYFLRHVIRWVDWLKTTSVCCVQNFVTCLRCDVFAL